MIPCRDSTSFNYDIDYLPQASLDHFLLPICDDLSALFLALIISIEVEIGLLIYCPHGPSCSIFKEHLQLSFLLLNVHLMPWRHKFTAHTQIGKATHCQLTTY